MNDRPAKKTKDFTREIKKSFINSTNVRKELDEYLKKLQDGTLTRYLEGCLCKAKPLISYKASFRVQTQEFAVMALNFRSGWVTKAVRNMVTNPCMPIDGI